MIISDEKKHLYSLMDDITKERRKLTEIYYGLKDRLDELNKLETKGLNELSLDGYIDLHNQRNREAMVNNISREYKSVVDKIKKEGEEVEEREETIPRHEIAESIARDNRNKVYSKVNNSKKKPNKNDNVSYDKVSKIIISILKEYGRPVSINDIHIKLNELSDKEVSIKNLRNNIIFRLSKENPRVERPMRGFYQYKN